jgi:CheY-like chemotaxis protein
MNTTDKSSFPQPLRVLLVEDNPQHSFVAVTVLHQLLGEGSEIFVAETAAAALDLLDQFTPHDRPDLILVDLRLPDGSGLAVLSAVSAHQACAHVPTLVITGSLYEQDVAQSYHFGAAAVLGKPLSRASLREELVRIGSLTAAPPHVCPISH